VRYEDAIVFDGPFGGFVATRFGMCIGGESTDPSRLTVLFDNLVSNVTP
jgi:hypothetical protein